jgi:AMP-binding enzyme
LAPLPVTSRFSTHSLEEDQITYGCHVFFEAPIAIQIMGTQGVRDDHPTLVGASPTRNERHNAVTRMDVMLHRPDGTAFLYDEGVLTYQELLEAEQLSGAFVASGVRQGDRIVLHMPSAPEMAASLYACFRVGAIASSMRALSAVVSGNLDDELREKTVS